MDEVSCRALGIMFSFVESEGHALGPLLQGLAYPQAHLSDVQARVDWATFLEVVRRFRVLFPAEADWLRMGRSFLSAPQSQILSAIYRLFGSPRAMHKWGFRFGGFRLFSNMLAEVREVGFTLHLTLTIQPEYLPCPEYFWICQGVFSTFPRLVAQPDIPVSLELSGNTGFFVIDYAPLEKPGPVRRMLSAWWQRLRNLVAPRAAIVSDFEHTQLLLENRYLQLERAKEEIEGHQRALQMVHEISTTTHTNLRLEPTVAAIADQLAARLGFAAVLVRIDLVQDQVHFFQEELRGSAPLLQTGFHREPLSRAGQSLGYLQVSRGSAPITDADRQVLQAIAESTYLALNNAVAFEVIRGFREDLEQRVVARTAELSEARDQISRSMDSRNRFFANVNHELRTPLTVLLLGLDRFVGRADLPADSRTTLGTMQRNAERLQRLVDDLLLLAAGAEGQGGLRLAVLDPEKLVGEVVEALRPQAEAKGLRLSWQVEPGLTVEGDARSLDRALTNLLSNAIKYTAVGEVAVAARSEQGEVLFEVRDTGEGIPQGYLDRVFERFVQVPHAKGRPGAGIGLALVKEIAGQHQGRVEAESQLGSGTTFRLRLPRRAGEAVRAQSRPVTPLPQVPSQALELPEVPARVGATSSGPLVLVCEDNVELAGQLRELLAEVGLRVAVAHSGEEALALARAEPPDLLLTDVGLGQGMDGVELCRRFGQLTGHRNAPCLVLTANAMPANRLDALQAGAVDYLTKPFNPRELQARVQAQLALRQLGLKLLSSERLAAQGAALAGVAHELRNPLNGLVNAVEPLRLSLPAEALGPNSAASELLEVIEDCGRRVAALSGDLLSFARADPPVLEDQPLTGVVNRALKVVGPRLQGLQLRTELGFGGAVRCSSTQLSQVIINLVENAVDAAGPGGWVALHSSREGARVLLEVRDSGPGVPLPLRERIFEPFFTTKPPGKGTGLGLSISRDIVRRHGGNLEVCPDGERTAMRLSLLAGEEGGP